MKLVEVDWAKLRDDVIAIATGHPRHVSEESCYFGESTGTPICLLGHALARQGFTLRDMYRDTNFQPIDSFPVEATDRQGRMIRDWCSAVQSQQDAGMPWGQAVKGPLLEAERSRIPCGPPKPPFRGRTDEEMFCACGCGGDDTRCNYWVACYALGMEVSEDHRCCHVEPPDSSAGG